MCRKFNGLVWVVVLGIIDGCTPAPDPKQAFHVVTPIGQEVSLPPAYQTAPVHNYCKVIGWPPGKTPQAPAGFRVQLFADSLDNPRNMIVGSNGDLFVSEANTEVSGLKKIGANLIGISASQKLGKSANRIILLRDTNHDGNADIKSVFLSGLNQPYGMLIFKDWFYVANTDGLWRFPYKTGQNHINSKGNKILSLPRGGYNNHWTRNLRLSADSTKIYVAVGSGSNDGEHGKENEFRRAAILEINPDGSGEKIYANGLRNPNGLDIQPETKSLWAAVNERDGFGDELVPDFLTQVKKGGFYGWPYAYFGPHEDPTHKNENPDKVKQTLMPDLSLGAHTAPLSLCFYNGKDFPPKYYDGAFIAQHGSANRAELVGYGVAFIPFLNGKPADKCGDFLTGFICDRKTRRVYGRPAGVANSKTGSLFVSDDAGNKVWLVSYVRKRSSHN
ncbi:sorbosone dehydrogenase family protein [Mucilaginibacter sp.]|uniref:PQQ-dependent sugar dehydrogenase n=1 Tax=Mucilaginibacter sp. TaxID=1882438 RepID=UPI0025EE2824|nr:sorbosone dehydrogenase family protein [Mucilaginibacter sp.]